MAAADLQNAATEPEPGLLLPAGPGVEHAAGVLLRLQQWAAGGEPGGTAVLAAGDRPTRAVLAALARPGPGPGPGKGEAAGPLLLLATSGTSGSPRCVLRTLTSWLASDRDFSALLGPAAPDGLVWVPGGPTSTLTLYGIGHGLRTGLQVLATGPWRGVPDPARAPLEQVRVLHAVPPVAADALDARAAGHLPRLSRLVLAGAHCPAALRERASALAVQVVEYYGAAELSFVAAGEGGSLLPFPGVQVDLAEGLVWAASPYLALGYLDVADGAVGEAEAGPLRVRGRFATVGDRGRLTEAGGLQVLGRGADTANVGGTTVLLADVERALAGVPGVAEVVCVAEPDARLGERLVAVVRPSGRLDPRPALRRRARAQLPPPARPLRYLVMTELPRTSAGKVARAALRDQVARVLAGP